MSPPLLNGSTVAKYGPRLDDQFDPKYFDVCRYLRPSESDLRFTIRSLSNPENVSCETFETILAMHWNPTCMHLDVLLESFDPGIFPACIKLLRAYCEDGHGIFDHAYGFLCLQVITLSLEIAKLALRGDPQGINSLEDLLFELAESPDGRPISEIFDAYTREAEGAASFFSSDPNKHNKHAQSFAWYETSVVGEFECLPSIGGCHLRDIHFLMGQMWHARNRIYRMGKWAMDKFVGWTGLFYASWHIMTENNIRTDSTSTGGNSPEEKLGWSQIYDLVIRYVLLPRSEEYDNAVLEWLIEYSPIYWAPLIEWNVSVVDEEDANRTTTLYLAKLKATPRFNSVLNSTFFGYACMNINQNNFQKDFPRLVEASFGDAFGPLRTREFKDHEWITFTKSNVAMIPIIYGLLDKATGVQLRTTVEVASSATMFELLGCLLLFPLSVDGVNIHNLANTVNHKLSAADNHDSFTILRKALHEIMQETGVLPNEDSFLAWYKTLECLHTQRKVFQTKPIIEYVQGWEPIWLSFREVFKPHTHFRAFQCAYPRCPVPDVALAWECGGCAGKHYCSQRCQQG